MNTKLHMFARFPGGVSPWPRFAEIAELLADIVEPNRNLLPDRVLTGTRDERLDQVLATAIGPFAPRVGWSSGPREDSPHLRLSSNARMSGSGGVTVFDPRCDLDLLVDCLVRISVLGEARVGFIDALERPVSSGRGGRALFDAGLNHVEAWPSVVIPGIAFRTMIGPEIAAAVGEKALDRLGEEFAWQVADRYWMLAGDDPDQTRQDAWGPREQHIIEELGAERLVVRPHDAFALPDQVLDYQPASFPVACRSRGEPRHTAIFPDGRRIPCTLEEWVRAGEPVDERMLGGDGSSDGEASYAPGRVLLVVDPTGLEGFDGDRASIRESVTAMRQAAAGKGEAATERLVGFLGQIDGRYERAEVEAAGHCLRVINPGEATDWENTIIEFWERTRPLGLILFDPAGTEPVLGTPEGAGLLD